MLTGSIINSCYWTSTWLGNPLSNSFCSYFIPNSGNSNIPPQMIILHTLLRLHFYFSSSLPSNLSNFIHFYFSQRVVLSQRETFLYSHPNSYCTFKNTFLSIFLSLIYHIAFLVDHHLPLPTNLLINSMSSFHPQILFPKW